MVLHAVRNFVNQKAFSCKHVSTLYDVISQLRHNYAKGPFCVTWLILQNCHISIKWIKWIGDVVKRRIRRLKHSVNTRSESIFRDPDVVHELSRLHENFVIVLANKASNNYTFVCKKHFVDILIKKLGLHSLPGNPTCNLTDFSASEVLDNHKSVLTSFGIQANSEELDLP